ncbi:MAG: DUF1552 domain-containing protein [Opitutus sp.]|nr:DUF1552 domain-containing protein [Opitutus sp.]
MTTTPPAYGPFIATRQPLSRRHFLRGTGVALALPFLDVMRPAFSTAAESNSPLAPGAKPRRFFAINNNLGLIPRNFFPEGSEKDYQPSPYLELLQEHRKDFTVFSGVSYPNVDGGHPAEVCFITAAPHPGSGSFRNSISLDQYFAERIGILTRFPSITLSVNTRAKSLSCTGTGVAIPPEDKVAEVFKQLFIQGSAAEVEATGQKLAAGQSILDTVSAQAKRMGQGLGSQDRERIDQYFTSVRDLESRLKASEGWEHKPKPKVEVTVPVDPASPAAYMAKVKSMYDLARLAFQTDSTRNITLMLDSVATPVIEGIPETSITETYHNLSHHGQSPDKLVQLKALDLGHMKLLAKMFGDFKAVTEGEESLLDRTMIYYGSNFGDANQHTCFNMPALLAGGGFRHGQQLAFDREHNRNYNLCNLFVSIIQRMGIDADKFATSTGTMRGLEMK